MYIDVRRTQGFDQSIAYFTEGSLFDRKVELYKIYGDGKKQAEFLKDVLALANAARSQGKNAYILFGISDLGEIKGIQNQVIHRDLPKDWEQRSVEKQQEFIGAALIKLIKRYLGGGPFVNYEWGYIEDKLISYLEISGRTPSKWLDTPYKIEEDVVFEKVIVLEEGECYVRIGESKDPVPPDKRRWLYSAERMPFIDPNQWRVYLRSAALIQVDASLSINCMVLDTDELVQIEQVLNTISRSILDDVSGIAPRILVTNQPGCGKTTTLRRIYQILAEQALYSMDGPNCDAPMTPIPIFISLWNFSCEHRSIVKDALLCLEQNGIDFSPWTISPEILFDNRRLRFTFILDGYDEMSTANLGDNKRAFDAFVDTMRRHGIIVSCRSTRIDSLINLFKRKNKHDLQRISIQNISDNDIGYFMKGVFDDDVLIKTLIFEMNDIISRPMGLTLLREACMRFISSDRFDDNPYLSDVEQAQLDYDTYKSDIENTPLTDKTFLKKLHQLRQSLYDLQSKMTGTIRLPLIELLDEVIPTILVREIEKFDPLDSSNYQLTYHRIKSGLEELAWRQIEAKIDITPLPKLPVYLQSHMVQEWLIWTGILGNNTSGFNFTSSLIRDYFVFQYLVPHRNNDNVAKLILLAPERVQEMFQQRYPGMI